VARAWPSNVDKHAVADEPPVRLCNYTDVYKNASIVEGMTFMAATAPLEQIERFRIAVGDTLLTKDSETADDIGVPAYVEYEADDLICGYHLSIVRPNPGAIVPKFLYWALSSGPTAGQWVVLASGVTRVGIRAGDLSKATLALPPIDEQRTIADYLDRETARIDTLIAEQQRLIQMLRERRTAVISSSWEPNETWARRRIKHIGDTSLGKMLDAGRTARDGDEMRPYVRAADVLADGSVNLVDLNEMPFSESEMSAFDIRAGDILLIEGGATVGRPGYVWESAPGIAFQKTVNRLRVGPETDARFVYWSMLRLYEAAYYSNHFGSVSFVHLTGEKLREIELHLPAVEEQRRIAAHLDDQTSKIETMIVETERFIELSRERRAALITATVTGQVDVREVA
jgi:type I restriction enzyme S subunit